MNSLLARATTLCCAKNSTFCCRDETIAHNAHLHGSGDLTHEERLDYVNAVLCLQNLPPRTPVNVSAGARSRVSTRVSETRNRRLTISTQFDDFVVTHIQQTLTIHYTGNFMPWHRWFLYSYEKALRDECGYKGYQPVRYLFHLTLCITNNESSIGTGPSTHLLLRILPFLTAARLV